MATVTTTTRSTGLNVTYLLVRNKFITMVVIQMMIFLECGVSCFHSYFQSF